MKINDKTWVLVTGNPGKASEFKDLLAGKKISLLTLKDVGFNQEIEETGTTFEENVRIKLNALNGLSSHVIIADDSGLVVDVLNGEPGVYSARYAGSDAGDADNRKKLLRTMDGIKNRSARFVCALGIKTPSEEKVFFGKCEGNITLKEKGNFGFGYDSLFVPLGHTQTFAELGEDVKHTLSHRGNAFNLMLKELQF